MSATRAAGRTKQGAERRGLGDAIWAQVGEDEETLEGASIRLGLKPNTLWRWTRGIEPTPPFYDTLMVYLGVTLDELGALIVADQLRRWNREHP